MISFALGITNGEDPDPHSQPPLTQYPEASSETTSHRATTIFAIAICTWKKTLCTGKGGTCQEELSRERDTNCGRTCAALDATGWVQEGTCASCKYATPPDSD
ncbi:hypothetical protein FOMA001_g17895 [Fusarium oxysporum f. sp. matthiolae]|nr:hypothetical protein FOMA001_g17895 [Fusarium oxysporum f. sp. matthiolae]